MIQSAFLGAEGPAPELRRAPAGLHAAIIMDGNGRWARSRGRPRTFGHRAGARAVRRVVEAAPGLGIGVLTLYAFSTDNWRRPPREVMALMGLFRTYLRSETANLVENGVRLEVIGRRDRLSETVRSAIEGAEAATREGERLLLRVAVDYGSRDAIVRAAAGAVRRGGAAPERDEFARLLAAAIGSRSAVPDVDLLIRTGGEQRLSDFLLWESAYAELYFTRKLWPDFDASSLEEAVREFHARERRFGAVPEAAAG